MIAKMLKVHVVARAADRDALLEALRGLSVVHLVPVDANRAVADAETVSALDRFRRARQVLEMTTPAGAPPDLAPEAAADEVLRIQRESAELGARLSTLHRRIEQLALWGDVRLEEFEALRAAGVEPRFFLVPTKHVADVRAEVVHVIGLWPGRRSLVAVIHRGGEPELPEGAEPVPLPQADRPTLRAEATRIDAALQAGAARTAALAHLAPAMAAAQARLVEQAAWTVATRSALADEHLYALQGWVPEGRAASLAADLRMAGVAAAVEVRDAAPAEEPPTLIHYPWWARPMKGLFDMLGTVPGYTEFDVSAAFMIALPILSAILISDTGYGLLYLLLPVVFYRRMKAAGVAELAQLVMVIGACSVVWGVITCSIFGYDFSWLLGRERPFIPVNMEPASMDRLMLISATLGAIHLAIAHLWKAKAAFPRLTFLSEVGWVVWFYGIYGLVIMVLTNAPFELWRFPYYPWGLIVGGSLAVLFSSPDRNPLKMLGLGLANFPLSAIGSFGDTMSYLRLMAIGLAGSVLAVSFNEMTSSLPIVAMIPLIIIAHALNVALSIISLLAHGVRLNMLEFSNNLGMQWSGYAYEPFSRRLSKET
jgi:V/A-type H+-transporting ATPase subunit I